VTAPQTPPPIPPPVPPAPPNAGLPVEGAPYGYAPPPGGPSPAFVDHAQQMPGVPAHDQYAHPQGPVGQIRPTGMIILLFFVTFGIWGFVYYFQVHEELKRHSGEGLGGVLGLVLAIIFGIVSPFLLSNEVGLLYERRGQEKPVTALTALWFFPGILILVGPIVWFVRTNDALNAYWESLGQTRTTLV
jgi:hypothetical protein